MTISPYLSKVIADIREDVRWSTIEVWKESKQKTSSDDAYGRTSSITSGARWFSGSLGWTKTKEKEATPGGYYNLGDVNITASLSAKTGAGINLSDDGVYLVAEGVKLNIMRITEASETKDMLIACERISQ
jgi:hypothetical protein